MDMSTSLLSRTPRVLPRHLSLHILPFIPVTVGLLMVITNLIIFFVKGNNKPVSRDFWWPSISKTGAAEPESIIFSIGLHIIAFVSGFLGWSVFVAIEDVIRKKANSMKPSDSSNFLNASNSSNSSNSSISLNSLNSSDDVGSTVRKAKVLNALCGVTMCVFYVTLMGTGAVSMDYSYTWHGSLAGTMFLVGMAYCVFHAWVVHVLRDELVTDDKARFWYRWKVMVSAMTLLSAVIYVPILGAVQKAQKPKCGHETWCEVRNIRNVIEFVLVGLLMLYFCSFYHDLDNYTISVTTLKGDSDENDREIGPKP